MPKKIRNMTGVVAGLAALALGGSALAGAAQHVPAEAATTPAVSQESTSGPDTDNVQSGDQTTPDTAGASATTADVPSAGDQADNLAGETPGSESAADSDGPGGHADEPGNPDADNQSQGQN